jgi:hypothetical protein
VSFFRKKKFLTVRLAGSQIRLVARLHVCILWIWRTHKQEVQKQLSYALQNLECNQRCQKILLPGTASKFELVKLPKRNSSDIFLEIDKEQFNAKKNSH